MENFNIIYRNRRFSSGAQKYFQNYALHTNEVHKTYWNFPIGIRSSSTAISVLVCFMICIYCSIELCIKFFPMYCRCRLTSTNSFLYKLWKHRTFALIFSIIIKVCALLHITQHKILYIVTSRPICYTFWTRCFLISSIQFVRTVILVRWKFFDYSNIALELLWSNSREYLMETYMRITSIVILRWYQISFDVIFDENRIFFRHFRARFKEVLIF